MTRIDTTHTTITSADKRATELQELAASEGFTLALTVDLIIWLEDRGHVVDLRTGQATLPTVGAPTPSGKAVSYLLTPLQELIDYGAGVQELQDARDDEEFWRSGC